MCMPAPRLHLFAVAHGADQPSEKENMNIHNGLQEEHSYRHRYKPQKQGHGEQQKRCHTFKHLLDEAPDDWCTECSDSCGTYTAPPALPLSAAAVVCGRCSSPLASWVDGRLPIRCDRITFKLAAIIIAIDTIIATITDVRSQHTP